MEASFQNRLSMVEPVTGLINTRLYRKVCKLLPVLCVDLMIWRDGRVLLIRRLNHPMRGKFWVVGGRVYLGEHPDDAAYRKAKEEVGLTITGLEPVGYCSDVLNRSATERSTEYHTVSIIYRCDAGPGKIKLDSQSNNFKWARNAPEQFLSKATLFGSIADGIRFPCQW